MTSHVLRRQISPALSPEQEARLEALVQTLTPEQALWVSGYLAGVARQTGPALPAQAPAAAAVPPLAILYASESGNGAALASALEAAALARGIMATVSDLAEYSVRSLKKERFALFISSTHGEGDPPDTAATFFEDLRSKKAAKLPDLRFSVLSLGDSTYEFYCEAGKILDRRLEELGAQRLHDRVDCDVDYQGDADRWSAQVLDALKPFFSEPAALPAAALPSLLEHAEKARFDKATPFPAPILDSVRITGRGSSKIVQHLELSLEGSDLAYLPGDALGVVPQNDPALVGEVIEALQPAGGADDSLVQALRERYEITALTPKFLEFWTEQSAAGDLRALQGEDNRVARRAFLEGHHLLDVMRRYPVPGLATDNVLGALRTLQPRLYSLASSLAAVPDEAHVTVSLVEFSLHGRLCRGVASGQLCLRLDEDGTLPVYIQENRNFRLPADPSTPIVMVGAGTGVAPYRAFMQERRESGAGGKSWLMFGERTFRADFLYQTEWQRLLKDGQLSRMDVAFSRDQGEKVYVQQRMRENAAELYAWLQDGAHFYLCGDSQHLAPDVHQALVDIVAAEGALGIEAAEDYVRELQREKRYQRDVY